MELCIRLDLPDPQGMLKLETEGTEADGEVRKEVRLPFNETESSIIARALDINASSRLKRRFSAEEIRQLWEWGVLCQAPSDDQSRTLSASDLHREKLRDFVRRRLYETLLSPLAPTLKAHFAYLRGRGEARPTLHVHLEMWSDQVALFQFPWELLHDDRNLGGEVYLSRYIRYHHTPVGTLEKSASLRLLVLHSDPQGLPALSLQDDNKIAAALRTVGCSETFQKEFLRAASSRMLSDALHNQADRPTVLHFAGHGDFGRRCEQCGGLTSELNPARCKNEECRHSFPPGNPCGYLAFTHDTLDKPHWISAHEFCQTLKLGNVQLVVLNACKSALGRRGEDVFNGVAQQLMDSVPAVVATPFPLDTKGAEEFTRCFYEGLGKRLSLVDTLHKVRLRMLVSYPDEWYRPVLYLRSHQKDGGCLLTAIETGSAGQSLGSPQLLELPAYLVDYDDQEFAFHRQIEIHRGRDEHGKENPARQRPLIFLMPGWADDTTTYMLLKRLLNDLQNRLGRYDDNYKSLENTPIRTPTDLNCTGAESQEALRAALLDSMRRSLFGNHYLPQELHQAQAYIQNFTLTEPVIFYAHLELAKLHQRETEEFLSCFYEFWSGWVDQNHLLLICIYVSFLKEPCTLWERAADFFQGHHRINSHFEKKLNTLHPRCQKGIQGAILPTLRPVSEQVTKHWARQMENWGLLKQDRVLNQVLNRIDELFNDGKTPLIRGALPIDELCKYLDKLLMQCELGNGS